MMLFILVMYSVKPLPVPWAAFKEVGKQIPTPFVQRGENTGGNQAAISKIQTHLQAITLPMEGKYELRVGFLIYFFLTFTVWNAAAGKLGHAMSSRERSPLPLMAPLPFPPTPAKHEIRAGFIFHTIIIISSSIII